MENIDQRSSDIEKLGELIKGIRIAMLTTVDESGELRSRPMATQDVDFDGDLWFFTQEHSPKVGEVTKERQVNVSFSDPSQQRYISVSGSAGLVTDRAKIEELWSPILKAWFPEGLDDPELALLKVSVRQAEYWDGPPSKVVQLIGFVKAAITHKHYNAGEHENLNIGTSYVV